ncbi:MAG: hpch/hpai aldolase [Rhizobiales bacterium]|nr:hpch/hpai aldolase [Hyphomicrobiales bacterium]
MAAPSLKAMARSKDLKIGHFIVEFATPGIGQILKGAGCDFALFDTEHSGFGFETIKSVLRYMQAADLPTIVRVPSDEYNHIARAADMGAEGIMVPMIGTADQARAVVHSLKYHPEGGRGVALGIAHDRYMPGPTMEKLAAANQRTTFFAQIETADGVANADEIAAVDGVDCLWIGHFDLSSSLGIPGDFEHKLFKDAVKTVTRACEAHGKALGRLVPTVEEGVRLNRAGHDFICYSGDVWALQQAVAAAVSAIREAADKRKARARPAAKAGTAAKRGPAKSKPRTKKKA